MRNARRITSAVALVLVAETARGQRPDSISILAPVVTTATRSPSLASDLPQHVVVIGRQDIASSGSTDLTDALKKLAGVDVIQYPGLLGGIGIRGFRPETGGINKHVQILIDGRPAGISNIALVDLSSIERIEIVRGPASAAYGSSAMGGVVNIIRRRSLGQRHGSVSALGGSFGTSDVNATLGGGIGSWVDGDVSARAFRAGNYRIGGGGALRSLVGSEFAVRYPTNGVPDTVRDLGDGEIRDGSRYAFQSGSLRLGVKLPDSLHVESRGTLFRAENVEVPGDIFYGTTQNSRKNARAQAVDVRATKDMGQFKTLARAYASGDGGEFYNDASPNRFINFESNTSAIGGQFQATVGRSSPVTVGADFNRSLARSRRYSAPDVRIAPFSPDASVQSLAGFLQAQQRLHDGRVVLTGGVRLDHVVSSLDETEFRPDVSPGQRAFNAVNPNVGVAVRHRALRAHGSIGRAFVAPDAFGRAGLVQSAPVNGVVSLTVGNSALTAEHSVTSEFGLGLVPDGRWDFDVTGFRTRVSDRVTTARATFAAGSRPTLSDGNQVGTVSTSANASRASIDGIEARIAHQQLVPFSRNLVLRLSASGTRILQATELARAARIDAAPFTGRTGLGPEDFANAIILGDEVRTPVRNVANLIATSSIELTTMSERRVRLGARYVGHRRDVDFTSPAGSADIEYPAFLVTDLLFGSPITQRTKAELLVNNVTDENYYEKRGYNLPGRSFQFRLTATY